MTFRQAIDSGERVVVLYTNPVSCAPCRAFKPHWERVQKERSDLVFYTVDITEHPVEGIYSVPTLLQYRDGIVETLPTTSAIKLLQALGD